MKNINRLKTAIAEIEALVSHTGLDEDKIVESASSTMLRLVAEDDWLPDEMAVDDPQRYQQHLLYADPQDRFSLVSFVWGPGQQTPIHNHTVWGIVAMLRGSEYGQRYEVGRSAPRPVGKECLLNTGEIDVVSPSVGDVHLVRNAVPGKVSISIHLYGGNIGKISRSIYDPVTGEAKPFVSGYSKQLALT